MFAVVYVPNFSLQAVLRHEPQAYARLVALVDNLSAKPLVIQATPAAQQWGVDAGLTPSQATARCPGLKIKQQSAAQEKAVMEVLLQTAYAFSPRLEATAPGVCTIELAGLGLATEPTMMAWALKLFHTLAGVGLDARIGITSTPSLASLAARTATPVQVAGDPDEFIDSLPLAALDPPPHLLEILIRWGIRNVGQFRELGQEQVVERLGEPALQLFAAISTGNIRPLKLVAPPEQFVEEIEFEHEVETAEPLLFILRRFVEQLSRRLDTLYFVIGGLDLTLGLSSGVKYERHFKIPEPTGRVDTLFRILQTHLETVRTETSIVALKLTATAAKSQSHQFGLFETTLRDPNRFADTLARLTALCGTDRVGTPIVESTHRPDTFHLEMPDFNQPVGESNTTLSTGLQLRRFRPPVPAIIEFREDRPVLIHSPVFTGAVTGTRGPFRSSGDWWDQKKWAREEWDVQTNEGALYRIFRSPNGAYIEGVYD